MIMAGWIAVVRWPGHAASGGAHQHWIAVVRWPCHAAEVLIGKELLMRVNEQLICISCGLYLGTKQ